MESHVKKDMRSLNTFFNSDKVILTVDPSNISESELDTLYVETIELGNLIKAEIKKRTPNWQDLARRGLKAEAVIAIKQLDPKTTYGDSLKKVDEFLAKLTVEELMARAY